MICYVISIWIPVLILKKFKFKIWIIFIHSQFPNIESGENFIQKDFLFMKVVEQYLNILQCTKLVHFTYILYIISV